MKAKINFKEDFIAQVIFDENKPELTEMIALPLRIASNIKENEVIKFHNKKYNVDYIEWNITEDNEIKELKIYAYSIFE